MLSDFTMNVERRLAKTASECYELRQRIESAQQVGFDTESAGPDLESGKMLNVYRSTLVGCSFAFPDAVTYYMPVQHRHSNDNAPVASIDAVLTALNEPTAVWAFNWKHDYKALARRAPFPAPKGMADSMVLMWLLGMSDSKGRYGLKGLAEKYFDVETVSFKQVLADYEVQSWDELRPKQALKYATDDAWYALQLGLRYMPLARERKLV